MERYLVTDPYSFDDLQIEEDKHGRAKVRAKIMKVGKLKYTTQDGKVFYGNITLDHLEKAKNTIALKPITIRHPPSMLNPDDIKIYQEGVSADSAKIEEIDGETWLTNDIILQTNQAKDVVRKGKLGVSAGYYRDAIPISGDTMNFDDIDVNHIAIGCASPRAGGAGIYSLDEADDSGKIISFAEQQTPKSEVKMAERVLNAVSVGAFSMDEAPIEYEEGSKQAIQIMLDREKKLVEELKNTKQSLDDKEEVIAKEIGDLKGQVKGLESQNKELEEKLEKSVSMDELDDHVEELAGVRQTAKERGIKESFKTPFDGKKLIVNKVFPDQSFDDSEIEGAYKTIRANPKDSQEMIKSNNALANAQVKKGQKVPLYMLDPAVVKKIANRKQ